MRRSEELCWHDGESVITRAHTHERVERRCRARQAYNTLHTTDVSRAHDRKYVFALLLVAPMGLFKIGVFASYLDSRRNDYAVTKPYRNGRIVT